MLSDPTATQRYTKAPIANFYFTAVDGLFRCRTFGANTPIFPTL
ncbi:hypothetical protein F441_16721 [Phytophthora nicotianae CJ01A1]|uniref:Uncharacterized protein n=1 Tax=Phytophthora nicotianae CJ01A1 TaxID=1317063 RepID=W2W8S5_PHYNI|nr:hypothetical protein F441_16721 [Phytophthora nicotianae CJ01A1]